MEISEGSAPDNDAAPSVAPLYHSLKLFPVASLEECSRTDLSTHQSDEQAKLAGRAFWLGDVDYTTHLSSSGLVCAFGVFIS